MFETAIGAVTIRISLLFPAMAMVLLSLDPSHTVLLCLSASVLHELGHAFAMFIVRDHPRRITVGVFGVTIEREYGYYSGYLAAVFVSLAGPFVNFLCFAFLWGCDARVAAAIHLGLGCFNLLPIVSLDGGEALYALLCRFCMEQKALCILRVVSVAVIFPLVVCGFILLFIDVHNITLLLLCGYLILLLFLREKH